MLSDHADEIAATFEFGQPLTSMATAARGEQGQVWRLDTERGTYAVKELFVRQTEAEAAEDVAYQDAVSAPGDVPMPRPIRAAAGTVLAAIGDHQVRAYEWVDLLGADLELDPALVGRTVALIHRVRHEPARPFDGWYGDLVGQPRWTELSTALRRRGAPFSDFFDEQIPSMLELERLIEMPTTMQNCHRDLWADNMLPTTSGGICVVDWENCGLADPNQELAMPLFDFTYGSPKRSALLVDAYVEAGGLGRLQGRGSFTMVIAQFGHFMEMAAERWLDLDSTDADRARAVDRIEEFRDRRLSVDVIDEMLDAVHR